MDFVIGVIAVVLAGLGVVSLINAVAALNSRDDMAGPAFVLSGILMVIAMALGVLIESTYYVAPTDVAIIVNGWSGEVRRTGGIDDAGWKLKTPFMDRVTYATQRERVLSYNKQNASGVYRALNLRDFSGNTNFMDVDVRIALDVRVAAGVDPVLELYKRYGSYEAAVDNVAALFRSDAQDAFQALQVTTQEFFDGTGDGSRVVISDSMAVAFQASLEGTGFRVIAVNIRDVDFNDIFEERVARTNEQAQNLLFEENRAAAELRAQEGRNAVLIAEAEARAEARLAEAQGEAEALLVIAEAEAEADRTRAEALGGVDAYIALQSFTVFSDSVGTVFTEDGIVPVFGVDWNQGNSNVVVPVPAETLPSGE